MSSLPQPPLGHLQGMYYDHERKRYFPLQARPPGDTAGERVVGVTAHLAASTPAERKSFSTALLGSTEGIAGRHGICEWDRKRGRGAGAALADVNASKAVARRVRRHIAARETPAESRTQDVLSNAVLDHLEELCQCHGEVITSMKSHPIGAVCLTTDHGKIIWMGDDGEVRGLPVCSQQLLHMHTDVPRGTCVVVSNGSEPHIHSWRTDHDNPDQPDASLATVDFPHRDIWAASSFDDLTSLGSSRSLHTAMLTESSITVRRRKLPSDVLAVHHASRDMVFAGLRSSAIVMEDLRVPSKQPNIVATLPAGKAVTGVQRLRDSAVPFGLAVSGLSHQLMLFDIRFARPPLLEFEGHVNTYHISSLALTTSPDDSVLIAGGSDCRLRAWSTRTGNRIESRGPEGAFSMTHSYRVQHVDVADDLTIRVATAGDVLCFRPPR